MKVVCLVIVLLCVTACVLFFKRVHSEKSEPPAVVTTQKPDIVVSLTNQTTKLSATNLLVSKIRHRASEFSDEEKAVFLLNFEGRYKPAISNWFKAYNGHIPFDSDAVTPEKLVERIGIGASFGEYVFVVDEITLGVRDSRGVAQVDYLNDPKQTRKMSTLPNGAEAPIAETRVNRQEVTQMVAADSGTQFLPNEIRLTPSGFSGGLNGGVIVHIGGDPQNGASWKFDMVFGPDGKLAYYLKGL